MKSHRRLAVFVGVGIACLGLMPSAFAQFTFPPFSAARTSAGACAALNSLALREVDGISAEWLEAGPPRFVATGTGGNSTLPPHCRISVRVPQAVRIEVWLPALEAWNGRFLGLGGSAAGGSLNFTSMAAALTAGYATASTDTGHQAGDFAWVAEAATLRDFAYRAIYEMTAQSRSLLEEFYGKPADFRYFNGCGLGGRQGLMEAQRFPEDYDGIVAGSPGPAVVDAAITRLWASTVMEGASTLRPESLALVHSEAMAECDALDGATDGLLEDPRRCTFEPGRLQCGVTSGAACLSTTEVTTLRQLYAGPAGSGLSSPAMPGLSIGSEREWSFAGSASPDPLTVALFRGVFAVAPDWSWRNFDYVIDGAQARETLAWLDATATDLEIFRSRGGKLIVYQGWNDSTNPPEATIQWYEAVEAALPADAGRLPRVDSFARLFMVPGMAQCGSVDTAAFDMQPAIEAWVERGVAPDGVEARIRDSDRDVSTRPLCPYPQVARNRGTRGGAGSDSYICAI